MGPECSALRDKCRPTPQTDPQEVMPVFVEPEVGARVAREDTMSEL